MNAEYDWLRPFSMPIDLPDGGKIETLRDAAHWLTQAASGTDYQSKDLQSAIRCVSDAAKGHGSMLLAQISMIQAINSRTVRPHPRSVGNKPVDHHGQATAAIAAAPAKKRRTAIGPASPSSAAVKKAPQWVRSLGFSQLASDQRSLWQKRLLAMTPRPAEQSQTQVDSPAILDLLTQMHADGGAIYWKEGMEPPFNGLDEAIHGGYVVRLSGANHEGITLTRRGRRVLGLGRAPSLLERTARRLGYPIKHAPLSPSAMRRQLLSSLTMEKAPELSRVAAVFEPYRRAGYLFLHKYRTLRGWKMRGK